MTSSNSSGSGAAMQNDSSGLASITVSSRIPEFWCDKPRLWFVQTDAILGPQKLSDESKYNLVVAKLGKEVIQQVSDILLKPPETKKFEALKSRLLQVYEESEIRQFQKLLSEMELGDQKPSQLLRKMKDLARDKIPDETLSIMWQGHLPASVRAVLAVTDVKNLENLAAIADKVMETSRSQQISEIRANTSSSNDTALILAEIAKLNLRINDLESKKSTFRNHIRRARSRSTSRQRNMRRRAPDSADWLCSYHYRYRNRAKKCIEPCAWNKNNQGN
ncbi:uncharacterized protein LOC123666900 [Melitaea cinxia]|uniref:uncharacterized protein LOC123663079 n=1 Tax=Melitaea cinxia TaxID=113334 RepID=UPI001E2749D1|nr:uncharacterized protein LOC123663079 [Melitaea cinxia]XP_045456876.1 uncharacterized protein LOC123666900 [Melitaea cinxia]